MPVIHPHLLPPAPRVTDDPAAPRIAFVCHREELKPPAGWSPVSTIRDSTDSFFFTVLSAEASAWSPPDPFVVIPVTTYSHLLSAPSASPVAPPVNTPRAGSLLLRAFAGTGKLGRATGGGKGTVAAADALSLLVSARVVPAGDVGIEAVSGATASASVLLR